MSARQKRQLAIGLAVTAGLGLAVVAASAKPKKKRAGAPEADDEDEDAIDDELPDFQMPDEIPQIPDAPTVDEDDDEDEDEDDEDDDEDDGLDDVLEDLPIPDEIKDRIPTPKKKKKKKKPPPPVVDTKPPEVEVPDSPGVIETPDEIQAPVPKGLDAETLALLEALLDAEADPNWKGRHKPTVRRWQSSEGIVVDGKFGPKSALRTAMRAGTVPIVRYWPKGSGANPQAAVDDYRQGLLEIAKEAKGAHAQLLRASAARETGQGFGPPQGTDGKAPVSPVFDLGGESGTFGTA